MLQADRMECINVGGKQGHEVQKPKEEEVFGRAVRDEATGRQGQVMLRPSKPCQRV